MSLDSTLNSVKDLMISLKESLTTALSAPTAGQTTHVKCVGNTVGGDLVAGSRHYATNTHRKITIPQGKNISIINGVVKVDGRVIHDSIDCYEIIINGDVESLTTDASVTAVNAGTVNCGGSCKVGGDVLGYIEAGGSIKVTGDHHGAKITAGGSIKIG